MSYYDIIAFLDDMKSNIESKIEMLQLQIHQGADDQVVPNAGVEDAQPQLTIQQAMDQFIEINHIHTKQQLDDWCLQSGYRGRTSVYAYVKKNASTHWDTLKDPRAGVRGHYETKLIGYKIYKH